MVEYEIGPNSRKCIISGRELLTGEMVYSVLVEEEGKFRRRDYSAECWQGPPENAFSHWNALLADPKRKQETVLDENMLMDCFERLEGEADVKQQNFRYILGLMLARKKKLRLISSQEVSGMERIVFRSPKTGADYEILHGVLSDAEMESLQEEVSKLAGCA
ncbi:MAG: hypothetical protein EXR99_11960 [Gemmataceae bacterium]|nr:hypothetical protein [Gemmataceae bacterium]